MTKMFFTSNIVPTIIGFIITSQFIENIDAQTQPGNYFQTQRVAESVSGYTLLGVDLRLARELAPAKRRQPGDPINEIQRHFLYRAVQDNQLEPRGFGLGPLAQVQIDQNTLGSSGSGVENLLVKRDGVGFIGVNRSATVGSVGIEHYVQMLNGVGGAGGDQVQSVDKINSATVINSPMADLVASGGDILASFAVTTHDLPSLLLVDDDDNDPDVRSFYTDALDALGQEFDLFDTDNTDNEPDAALLQLYEQIIWFTGDEFGGAAGPGAAGEAALADALSSGRCLLLSSQDYFFDRGLTDFMTNFLGLADALGSDDGNYTSVSGSAGSIFDGLGPYTLDYASVGITDFSDELVPAADAGQSLLGNNGNVAAVQRAEFTSTYLGFPLEVLDATGREQIISTFLDQCRVPLAEELFADGFEDPPVVP